MTLPGRQVTGVRRILNKARETRRLARQVLRLTRLQTGDLSSADVGDDVG